MPLISVIIPMKNAEPFVRAAVESVLNQRGVDLEVVVIDDGSTDRSAAVVRAINDSRIRLIEGPRTGISAAFNAGLAASKGEFLARCDADDLYPPDRLAWQLELLQQHPEIGAVCGSFAIITESGEHVAEQTSPQAQDVTEELRSGKGRSHVCAYLFRTELLRQINGCRTFFVTAEDVDLQLRLSEITRIWYDPRPAYLYRLHDASITHSFFEKCAREFQQQRQTRGQDDLQLGKPPMAPASDRSAPVSSRKQIQRILLGQAWAAHAAGAKAQAIRLGARAFMTSPLSPHAWRSVISLLLKPSKT
jgi:glycosyltransferase involved in cell wall biosynthesis